MKTSQVLDRNTMMRHAVRNGDESSPLPHSHQQQHQYDSRGSTAQLVAYNGSSFPSTNGHHHRQLSPTPGPQQYRNNNNNPQRRRIWFEWSFDNDDEDDTHPLESDINVDAVTGEFELILDLRDEICLHLGSGVLGDRGPSSVLLYADPRHMMTDEQQHQQHGSSVISSGGLFPIPLSKSLEEALGDQYSLNPSSTASALLIRVRIYDRANSVRQQSPMQRSSSVNSVRRLNSPLPHPSSSTIRSRPHTPPLRRAPSPIPMPTASSTTRTSPEAPPVQKKTLKAYPPPPQNNNNNNNTVATTATRNVIQHQKETAAAPLNGTIVVAEDQSEIPDDEEDAIEAQFDAGYAKFRSRTGGAAPSIQREQSEESQKRGYSNSNPSSNNNTSSIQAGRQGNAGRGRSPLTPQVPANMEVHTNNYSQHHNSPLGTSSVITPAPPRPTSAHPRTSHAPTTATAANPRMYSEPQQHSTTNKSTNVSSSPQQPLTPHRPQTAGPRSLYMNNSTSSPTATHQQSAKNAYSFKYRSEFAVQEFVMNKGWAAILKEQEEEVRAVTGGPIFGKTAWASRPSSAISFRESSYSPPTSAMSRRRSNQHNTDKMDVELSEGSGRTGDSGLTASSTLLRTPGEATRSSQEKCWEDEGKVAERARTYVAVSVDEEEDSTTSPRLYDNVVVGYDDDDEDVQHHPMEEQHQTVSTPPKRASISSQRPLTPTSLRTMLAQPATSTSPTQTDAASQTVHRHDRGTSTPVAFASIPFEQQRPQSIVHEVDSRSVSRSMNHVDGHHPTSTATPPNISTAHDRDEAISERSFRSAQQEEQTHPAHDDDEEDDKTGSDDTINDDDDEEDIRTDEDQPLEEEEEEATPVSSSEHDQNDIDDGGDSSIDEEEDDDEDDSDSYFAMPDEATETLPGAGISDLDMALLEGSPTSNPIVASPPSSPSPSRFRIVPRALTPTSTATPPISPHSEANDDDDKPSEVEDKKVEEEDTANTADAVDQDNSNKEERLSIEQVESEQRTAIQFTEEDGYNHLVDIEGQVVTSLARLADARAYIATEAKDEALEEAKPEDEAFVVEKDDDDPSTTKEDVVAAAPAIEEDHDPEIEISPTPSDDEKVEETLPIPPVVEGATTTPATTTTTTEIDVKADDKVPADNFAISSDEEEEDDGISPTATPQQQQSAVVIGIEPPPLNIEKEENIPATVEEIPPPPTTTTTTTAAVVSSLAIPSTYPLDDISQNVSLVNSAAPTPVTAPLQEVDSNAVAINDVDDDDTKDIVFPATDDEDGPHDDTTAPKPIIPPEVVEVTAKEGDEAPVSRAVETVELPSQPVEVEEKVAVVEDDSIVTFRDSPSQSAAMGSLTNSVNAIGPFDPNTETAIPNMLVQHPSLVNLPRQHSGSGSSSVDTESSDEEEFDITATTRLDRAFTFPISPRHSMVPEADFETQQPDALPDPLAQLETNSEPYARMLLEKRLLHWDVALSDPRQEDYFGRTAILPLRSYYADTFISAVCTEVARHEVMDRVFITETEAEIWETLIVKEGYTSIQELLVEDKASRFDRKLQNKLLKSMTKKALGGSSFRSGSSMRERSPTPDPDSHSTSSRQNGGALPLEPTLSIRSSASTAVQHLLNQQAGAVERKNSVSGIRRSVSFNTTHNTTVAHDEQAGLPPRRSHLKDSGLGGELKDDSTLHTLPAVTATVSGLDVPGGEDTHSNSSSVIVKAISPHSIRRPTECFTLDARSSATAETTNPLNANQTSDITATTTTQQPSPIIESAGGGAGEVIGEKPLTLMNTGESVGGHPARSTSPTMPQFDAPADCSGDHEVNKSGEDPMMLSSSPRPPKHSLRRLTQSLMALMPGSSTRPLGTASRSNSRSVISRSKPQQRPSSAEAANRLNEASMRVATIHDMLDGNHIPPSSGGTSPTERDLNNPQDQHIDAIRKAATNALDCSQLVSEPSSSRAGSPVSPRAVSNKEGVVEVRESGDELRSSSSAAMSIQSDDDDEGDAPQHDSDHLPISELKSRDSFSPAALQPFQQVQLQEEYDDEDEGDDDVENDAEAALLAAEDEGIMTRLDVPIDGMARDADIEQSVRIGRSVFDPTHEKLYHVVGEGVDEFAVEDDISSPDSSESSSLVETDDDDEPSPQPRPTTIIVPQQLAADNDDDDTQTSGGELNFGTTGSATTSEIQDFQINGEDEEATTSDVLELLQEGEEDGEEDDEL